MKRIVYVSIAGVVFAGLATTFAGAQSQQQSQSQTQSQPPAQSQSLGDYARAVRKQKDKNKDSQLKQYDNDNLPKDTTVSVVGNASSSGDNSMGSAPASGDQASVGQPVAEQTGSQAEKDKQKMYGDWKAKISAQKDKLDLLSRELDVLQREYKLRAAVFYADAGNRLRNSTDWDKEDAQYKQQIAEKQKAVDEAKQQLDGILEDARKAGVPASVRE
ncbi:MAG TPA: hypothetical protein VLW84_08385 [Terriglobales bacterium]|nr:hypothetical protein [Terriglobales bacterium]